MLEKVKEIVIKQLGCNPEELKEDTNFIEDLGADSLSLVDIVMAVEEEFDIKVPDEDAEKILTITDAVKYIKDHK